MLLSLLQMKVFSQTDSIEIPDFYSQQPVSEKITHYRSLLLDNIIADNKTKAKELFYYILQKLDDNHYLALYPDEKWLVSYFLRDFGMITSEITLIDSLYVSKLNNKVRPAEDQLYRILLQKVDQNKENIIDEIKASTLLSGEDQDFLFLLLQTYTVENAQDNQEILNRKSDKFLTEYPKSKYSGYIRNYIRYEYAQKGFSWGCELYSGAVIFGNKTSEYLSDGATFGAGILWGIYKFQINTRAVFVFSKLKNDITYNNVIWHKDERAQAMIGELSLGYLFYAGKKIIVSPVLGLGWLLVNPYENDKKKNPDLEDIEIDSYASPLFGIDLSWEFYHKNYFNYNFNKNMFAFYSLNVRYVFQPVSFPNKYNYLNGFVHSISLSLKFGFGGVRRVY